MEIKLFIFGLCLFGCKIHKDKAEEKTYRFNSDSSIVYFDCAFVNPVGRVPHNIPLIYQRIDSVKIVHPMIYGPLIPLDSLNSFDRIIILQCDSTVAIDITGYY